MKHIISTSGVYTITNIVDNKMYIGYATDMYSRCIEHRCNLRWKKHANNHLQNAWNKHGEESFLFEVLTECDIDQLISEENWWCNMLDTHNPDRGYNIAKTGDKGHTRLNKESLQKRQRTRRENAEKRGYWIPLERSIKMSQELKGKPVHKNMLIKSIEITSKKTIQYSKTGKILAMYKSQKEAGRKTGINDKCINAACTGKVSTAGGYVWRTEGDLFDKHPIIIEKPLPKNTKTIVQYTTSGNKIKEYQSLREANRVTGICIEAMRRQANGEMKTMNKNVKYIWKWKE